MNIAPAPRPLASRLLIMLSIVAMASAASADRKLNEVLAVFDALDDVRVVIDAREESAERVLASLQSQLPIRLEADWPALQMVGVSRHDDVTLRAADTTARSAIEWLLQELGDEFERPVLEAHAGRAVITTRRAAAEYRLPVVYDLRDLVADTQSWGVVFGEAAAGSSADHGKDEAESEPESDLPPDPEAPPDADASTAEPPADPPAIVAPRTPSEALMRIIIDHIDPEAWYSYGGDRAKIDLYGDVLIVTAAPSIHRDIIALTEQLRGLQQSSVTIELALVELPSQTLDRLRRRYNASGAALVQALMLDRSSTVLWRCSPVVAVDHETTQRIESDRALAEVGCTLTRSSNGQPIVNLEVSGRLAIGDAYRLTQPFLMAGRRPGAAIELGAEEPAASDGKNEPSTLTRVLVVRRLD